MVFTKKSMIVSYCDYNISDLLNAYENEYEIYCDNFNGIGNKIGGYPNFSQDDPRHDMNIEERDKFDTLLFQLDSAGEDDCDVMIGEGGAINFLIKLSYK